MYKIPKLPLSFEVETKAALKKAALAQAKLGELKGICKIIPNEDILINTLVLQEAKESSFLENIITTHDEIFKQSISEKIINPHTKEVQKYATAIKKGFFEIKKGKPLTNNIIKQIQETLLENSAGFRKQQGTTLKDNIGKTIYTPPQDLKEIIELMTNLEKFINENGKKEINPLIKMAIIHHQFETIHPFYDGNGRTGRIINILYLIIKNLLELPILYLSGYIIDTKVDYYNLLQKVRDKETWEEWIIYILEGVSQSATQTITLIRCIYKLMQEYKHKIREQLPTAYSQDLINSLFRHPYTKINFIKEDLGVSRQTATKYLKQLTKKGFLKEEKLWRSNYYFNEKLVDLLLNVRNL